MTSQGRETANLYSIVFWIAAAIFLLVEGLILWSVIRYRRRDDALPVQTHGNKLAELLWTVVPAIIVVVLFVISTFGFYTVEARSPNPAVTVDVHGFQWQWSFGYGCPQEFEQRFTKIDDCQIGLTGAGNQGPEMVVPVNETVKVRLHGADVNHAFYVPQFLYKKDVIPGHVNRFDVKVEQPGTYAGQCAEFCGLAHASMNFSVRAVPRAEFDAWLTSERQKAEERRRATPPPQPAAGQGGQQGAAVSISASNSATFDQKTVEAPANTSFTIQFENRDQAAPHNVAIKAATAQGTDFIGQPIAQPGQRASYTVPALAPREYQFYCSVHPNMQGTLSAK